MVIEQRNNVEVEKWEKYTTITALYVKISTLNYGCRLFELGDPMGRSTHNKVVLGSG